MHTFPKRSPRTVGEDQGRRRRRRRSGPPEGQEGLRKMNTKLSQRGSWTLGFLGFLKCYELKALGARGLVEAGALLLHAASSGACQLRQPQLPGPLLGRLRRCMWLPPALSQERLPD